MAKRRVRSQICQFDSWPLNIRNCLDLLKFRRRATYRWYTFDKNYNVTLDLISIEGLQKKLWASKITRILIPRILRLQLGSLETKCHWGASPMAMHKEHYNGEGGGFPQVRAVVSLVSPCLFVTHLCTKSATTTHYPTWSLACASLCE
jgi:hypothetical protein